MVARRRKVMADCASFLAAKTAGAKVVSFQGKRRSPWACHPYFGRLALETGLPLKSVPEIKLEPGRWWPAELAFPLRDKM
jgi:hypothetical protein